MKAINTPIDVFERIVRLLSSDKRALGALRLVSKAANCMVEPFFFKTVKLQDASTSGLRCLPVGAYASFLCKRQEYLRRVQHVSLVTGGPIIWMKPVGMLFQKLGELENLRAVHILTQHTLYELEGCMVRTLLLPVSKHLVSLRLEDVADLSPSFLSHFPVLQELSLLGVENFKEGIAASTSPVPRVRSLRYAQKAPTKRRQWDRIKDFVSEGRFMELPARDAIMEHPNRMIAYLDLTDLCDLHIESGFLKDVVGFWTIIPNTAATLTSIDLELTGSCSTSFVLLS
jgi:hypothetical protein